MLNDKHSTHDFIFLNLISYFISYFSCFSYPFKNKMKIIYTYCNICLLLRYTITLVLCKALNYKTIQQFKSICLRQITELNRIYVLLMNNE